MFEGINAEPPRKFSSRHAGNTPAIFRDGEHSMPFNISSSEEDVSEESDTITPKKRKRKRHQVHNIQQTRTPTQRRSAGEPAAVSAFDGSDSEDNVGSLSDFEDESDVADWATDDGIEVASDHESEILTWSTPKSWASETRNKPVLKKFCTKWTSPPDREDVKSVHTGPEQAPRFNVQPTGIRPFGDMFFKALPLHFWLSLIHI